MIIYNVTIKLDHSIHDSWLKWMKDVHIPDVVGSGCFTHAVFLHLIEADDADGVTYAIQYHTTSIDLYNRYIENYADAMRKKAIAKWGDKFVAFRTVMRLVN